MVFMRQLFSGIFVEDPAFLCEVALSMVEQQEQKDARKSKKERQAQSVQMIGKVMELVTLRHRLLESAWESELLADVSLVMEQTCQPLHWKKFFFCFTDSRSIDLFSFQLYKQTAVEMRFDECHLFMRFLQFDYAVRKEGAGKPPPLLISAVQEDDSSVDR